MSSGLGDAIDVIAKRLTAEIVGHSNDHNGGRLSGDQANGLAHLAAFTLLNQGYAIVKLPEDTKPFRIDSEGEVWDDDIDTAYTPMEANILAARLLACSIEAQARADDDDDASPGGES